MRWNSSVIVVVLRKGGKDQFIRRAVPPRPEASASICTEAGGTPAAVSASAMACARPRPSVSAEAWASGSADDASPNPVTCTVAPPRWAASARSAAVPVAGSCADPGTKAIATGGAATGAATGAGAGGGFGAAAAAVRTGWAGALEGTPGKAGGGGAATGSGGSAAGSVGTIGAALCALGGGANGALATGPTGARAGGAGGGTAAGAGAAATGGGAGRGGGGAGGAVAASRDAVAASAGGGAAGAGLEGPGGGADPAPNSAGEAAGEDGSAIGTRAASCWALVRSATSASAICRRTDASVGVGLAGTVARLGNGSAAPGGGGRCSAMAPPCKPCHHSTGLTEAGKDEQPVRSSPAPSADVHAARRGGFLARSRSAWFRLSVIISLNLIAAPEV